jgi:N-terminal domain of (some) glycogen debranching enzymes
MFADGVQWKLLNGGALAASAAQVYCTNPPILTSVEKTYRRSLILGRHIDGGMHEEIDITNYDSQKVGFNLVFRSEVISPMSLRSRARMSHRAARSGAIGPQPPRN